MHQTQIKTVSRTADELLRVVQKCVLRPRNGIAKQFVYRGIYAAQLERCARAVGRDRMVVINARDLEERPGDVLRGIWGRLGLFLGPFVHMDFRQVSPAGVQGQANRPAPQRG